MATRLDSQEKTFTLVKSRLATPIEEQATKMLLFDKGGNDAIVWRPLNEFRRRRPVGTSLRVINGSISSDDC